MSEKKNVKPIVRQEDLVMAVAAARTAWILTGVGRDYNDVQSISVTESSDLRWMLWSRAPFNTRQCASATGKRLLCVN